MSTENSTENTGKWQQFLRSGGAGLIAAVIIILLFLLGARYLKSLVFGIALAYFVLPLEKAIERKLLKQGPVSRFFAWIDNFSKKKYKTPEEKQAATIKTTAFRGTLMAVLSVLLIALLVIYLSLSMIIPFAIRKGEAFFQWADSHKSIEQVEQSLNQWLEKGIKTQGKEREVIKETVSDLRVKLKDYVEQHKDELASFAVAKGSNLLMGLIGMAKNLGVAAVDMLLTFFFFFYFLQKMAEFQQDKKDTGGSWCVQFVFGSTWMPKTSEETRAKAAQTISDIGSILNRWVHGYFSIILIEFVLYNILFLIAGVPYSMIAATFSCMTILLPFVGLIICISVTVLLCLTFCQAHLVMTLGFAMLIYLVVNGILEQLVLYPKFVGNAIGLTTVETIIVVLLGGLAAGIAGMIFAVPAAAIIKYMMPQFYELRKIKV